MKSSPVPEPENEQLSSLRRKLAREQKARREAEAIAERVTGELYRSGLEQERLNAELRDANGELQSLNQAIRDFVAVASHDLRTPLTSILGASQTLAQAWDRIRVEQRNEFLAIIHRQATHLSRMVDDLLTVSRIEAGELDTHREVIALREIFERIVADMAVPEISITRMDASVLVDPDHLQRMIVNYVGNAFKYGAPPVEIDATPCGTWVEIRVRDHGNGVPEEFVPRLFGKFARGDAARTQGGTGLGLSIVQGLARANGGDTWYEPNSPSGSCFAVRLPNAATTNN